MRRQYRKVKALMAIKGIKLVDLAEELGISVYMLSSYLNGYRDIPQSLQERIAEKLQTDKESLLP